MLQLLSGPGARDSSGSCRTRSSFSCEDDLHRLLHSLSERVLTGEEEEELGWCELQQHSSDLAGQAGSQRLDPGVESLSQLLLVVGQMLVVSSLVVEVERPRLVIEIPGGVPGGPGLTVTGPGPVPHVSAAPQSLDQ